MENKIDSMITIFLLYHLFRGYMVGFSKSLFLSVRFVGSMAITYWISEGYLDRIMQSELVRRYTIWLSGLLAELISPVLYRAIEVERKSMVVTVMLLVSIALNLGFDLLQSGMNKKGLRSMDKNLGFIAGGIKGLLYIMATVALIEPLIQKLADLEVKQALSTSFLLKYFYSYNVFLDIFSG